MPTELNNNTISATIRIIQADQPAGDVRTVASRMRWVSVGALCIGMASFFFTIQGGDTLLALGFSSLLSLQTMICLRWFYNPIHNGPFNNVSPLAIIELQLLIYAGLGNIFAIAGFTDPRVPQIASSTRSYLWPMFSFTIGALALDAGYRMSWRIRPIHRQIHSLHSVMPRYRLAVLTHILAVAGLGIAYYLSAKYPQGHNRYFFIANEFDNVLAQLKTPLLFAGLGAVSLSFWLAKSRISKAIYIGYMLAVCTVFIVSQNRLLLIQGAVLFYAGMVLVKPKQSIKAGKSAVFAVASIVLLFAVGSIGRALFYTDRNIAKSGTQTLSLVDKVKLYLTSEGGTTFSGNLAEWGVSNVTYRLNQLDWPAALQEAINHNRASFMYGEATVVGASYVIPRVLWPEKTIAVDTKAYVDWHYHFKAWDHNAFILSFMYADGGLIGVVLGCVILGMLLGGLYSDLATSSAGALLFVCTLESVCLIEQDFGTYLTYLVRLTIVMLPICSILGWRRPLLHRGTITSQKR